MGENFLSSIVFPYSNDSMITCLNDSSLKYVDFKLQVNVYADYILELENDLIFLEASNDLAFIIAFFGCLEAGKRVVPLSPYYSDEEREELIKLYDAFLLDPLSIDPALFDEADKINLLLPKNSEFGVFTSGSSGEKKIVFHNLSNAEKAYLSFEKFYQLGKMNWGMTLPFFHIAGLLTIFRCFFSGGIYQFDPTHNTDAISVVPRMLHEFSDQESLKFILVGGGESSPALREQCKSLPISYSYGQSESFGQITGTLSWDSESCGEILPGKKISIEDNLLKYQTNCSYLYYLSPGGRIDRVSEWVSTSDIVIFHDGKLFFKERSDVLLKVKGELINPLRIEDEILQKLQIKSILIKHPVEDELVLVSTSTVEGYTFKGIERPKFYYQWDVIEGDILKPDRAKIQNLVLKKMDAIIKYED